MRQDCIHFYDKMAWDRTAFIFMTTWHETGLHPSLWQASIRPVLIHFDDKPAKDRYSSIFMTSQHKTGTHPFYIAMYIHTIYTHIYVHIYTSQKECLCIFFPWNLERYMPNKILVFPFPAKDNVQVPAVRFSLCSWPSQCDHEALPSSCDEENPSPDLFSRNPET